MWRPAGSHAARIACCLLVGILRADVLANDSTGMPKFGEDLNNVTVTVGREAIFICNVEGLETYKVAWLRVDTQTILTIHSHVITKNHRIAVAHSNNRVWFLHIKNVKEADRGWYMCQINTDPMISQQGYLQVVVPPDILDYPTSTDMSVKEGSNVSMQCAASGFPAPSITWKREDSSKFFISPESKVIVVNGPWLNVSKVSRSHIGAYLCIASNGIPPTVSKRIVLVVQFAPMIWIQNQRIGVQEGQSVTLECVTEALPKSIDYWTKNKTTIISNGTKYRTDQTVDGYKTLMKLTIFSVTSSDFGWYQCYSKNSLGNADGSIKLNEILKPTTTTTSTTTIATTTTSSTTTTTTISTTSVAGGETTWWTLGTPKKSSKHGNRGNANEFDRRPLPKKIGKYPDASGANNREPMGDQQSSPAEAAAEEATAGDNNGRPPLSKKHKNESANVHPGLSTAAAAAAFWIITTQRICVL